MEGPSYIFLHVVSIRRRNDIFFNFFNLTIASLLAKWCLCALCSRFHYLNRIDLEHPTYSLPFSQANLWVGVKFRLACSWTAFSYPHLEVLLLLIIMLASISGRSGTCDAEGVSRPRTVACILFPFLKSTANAGVCKSVTGPEMVTRTFFFFFFSFSVFFFLSLLHHK